MSTDNGGHFGSHHTVLLLRTICGLGSSFRRYVKLIKFGGYAMVIELGGYVKLIKFRGYVELIEFGGHVKLKG